MGDKLDEDFIRHQMQINNPLWPFELGAIPAAAGEGERWDGGGLIALMGQPSLCLPGVY